MSSTLTEPVTATVRLARSGTTIARRSARLAAGTRAVELRTAGGRARLTVVYEDLAGMTKTRARTVTIPRKRAG